MECDLLLSSKRYEGGDDVLSQPTRQPISVIRGASCSSCFEVMDIQCSRKEPLRSNCSIRVTTQAKSVACELSLGAISKWTIASQSLYEGLSRSLESDCARHLRTRSKAVVQGCFAFGVLVVAAPVKAIAMPFIALSAMACQCTVPCSCLNP